MDLPWSHHSSHHQLHNDVSFNLYTLILLTQRLSLLLVTHAPEFSSPTSSSLLSSTYTPSLSQLVIQTLANITIVIDHVTYAQNTYTAPAHNNIPTAPVDHHDQHTTQILTAAAQPTPAPAAATLSSSAAPAAPAAPAVPLFTIRLVDITPIINNTHAQKSKQARTVITTQRTSKTKQLSSSSSSSSLSSSSSSSSSSSCHHLSSLNVFDTLASLDEEHATKPSVSAAIVESESLASTTIDDSQLNKEEQSQSTLVLNDHTSDDTTAQHHQHSDSDTHTISLIQHITDTPFNTLTLSPPTSPVSPSCTTCPPPHSSTPVETSPRYATELTSTTAMAVKTTQDQGMTDNKQQEYDNTPINTLTLSPHTSLVSPSCFTSSPVYSSTPVKTSHVLATELTSITAVDEREAQENGKVDEKQQQEHDNTDNIIQHTITHTSIPLTSQHTSPMSPASILMNNVMLIENLPKTNNPSITRKTTNTPQTKKKNNNNKKKKNKNELIRYHQHPPTLTSCPNSHSITSLDTVINSSPTPLLYKTVNRSNKMYRFIVTHRDNLSAQYLLREYPLSKLQKLCPCALYPPYKARRFDSNGKHPNSFFHPWLDESVSKWKKESERARNTLTD